MRHLYKVEVFARDYRYKDMTLLSELNVQMDYLTLENTTLTVVDLAADKGDFVHITDFYGVIIHQGIVLDVAREGNRAKLKVAPLLSLLDVQVQYDKAIFQSKPLEDCISKIITDTYISNADSLQNIAGIEVEQESSTPDTPLDIRSNIHAFWDIITKALTLYDIVVQARLEPQSKKMFFTVGKVSGKITLEAQLGNCLAHNFVLTDNYGTLNKITFINKDNENEKAIYYLHPSGAIDRKDENRITPVFFSAEYIQGAEDFLKEAYSRAYEQMTPEKYQQCIELSFREDDRMVSPNQIHIGQLAEIWYQDKRYTSVMTGYSRGKGVITLVFGCIRLELTKKLILSRRQEG